MTDPDLPEPDPRHPGLPEAGDRVQGHHAAAARPERAATARCEALADWARPRAGRLRGRRRGARVHPRRARWRCELDAGFVPARKPGKLPADTVSAEYILEYGVDALEMHADALAARRARADPRRPAGHRRHGARARRAGRGAAAAASSAAPSSSSSGFLDGPRAARGLRRPRPGRLRTMSGRPPLARGRRAGRRRLAGRLAIRTHCRAGGRTRSGWRACS